MANISDDIADEVISAQILILRTAEGLSKDIVTLLNDAHRKVMDLLERHKLTSFNADRLVRIKVQIERIIREFEREGYKTNRVAAAEIAKAVTKKTADDLNTIFGVKLFEPVLAARALIKLLDERALIGGFTLEEFWSRQTADVTAAYMGVIRNGLVTGLSEGQMLRSLANSDQLLQKRYQIRTLIRTSTMAIANEARFEMYRDSPDLVKGVQWLSTLDSRTSAICRGLDGLSWDKDFKPIGHDKRYPGHIAHPNCRSTQIPLLRSFADLATRNKDLAAKLDRKLSESTRASMDGQVSENLNYDQWLRKKGPTFARNILGATRFKLWEAGQLDLRDMLDQRSRPLTVAQLKKEFGEE